MVIVGDYKGVLIDSIKVVGGNDLKDSSGKYTLRVGTNYIFRVKTNQLGNSNLTHNLRDVNNIREDDCVALKSTTPKIEANGDYKMYEYQISAIKEGSQKIRFSAESEYVDCNVEVKSGGGGSTNTQGEIKLYYDKEMKKPIVDEYIDEFEGIATEPMISVYYDKEALGDDKIISVTSSNDAVAMAGRIHDDKFYILPGFIGDGWNVNITVKTEKGLTKTFKWTFKSVG